MAKTKLPIGLILRLIPAIVAGLTELADAMAKDSPGGKKVTKAEAIDIAEAVAEKIKPIIVAELTKD